MEHRTPPTSPAPIPASKVNEDLVHRVNAVLEMMKATKNLASVRAETAEGLGISPATLLWHITRLRRELGAKPRAPLAELAQHPHVRQVLESLLSRKVRSDKMTLLSARHLNVVMPDGERVAAEDFLKALYVNEGVSATDAIEGLAGRCIQGQVVFDDGSKAGIEDLPKERSVRRFLQRWREQKIAVRRARARRHDFETLQQPYVTRDVSKYRPGELWIGDHTELDFVVLNEDGKLDRRWITSFIDIRSGLIAGHHLSWQPNSDTIALAFRNGVLGSQLKAYTTDNQFEPLAIRNLPETVMIDNGKDYRSNQTQRTFGKIDFTDSARLNVQRLTKLHYVLPYHGQSKAQMERWYRTIQWMLRHLPGYKGNKYQNKPDSLAEDIKKGRILPVAQFDALVAIAINSYNNRTRRSLNNQSPLQCYLTNQTHQRAIDERVLDFLLMKVSGRRIRRCQIKLHGREYYSDSLMAHNDQLADVYYDPHDLGFVSIYVAGEFAAVASNKEMIGQDERSWLKILRDRTRSEKDMKSEIRSLRKGIPDHLARQIILEGRLLNMSPVPKNLLSTNVPVVTELTGLEQDAKEQKKKLERERQVVEMEKEAKRKAKEVPLTVISMKNIR